MSALPTLIAAVTRLIERSTSSAVLFAVGDALEEAAHECAAAGEPNLTLFTLTVAARHRAATLEQPAA